MPGHAIVELSCDISAFWSKLKKKNFVLEFCEFFYVGQDGRHEFFGPKFFRVWGSSFVLLTPVGLSRQNAHPGSIRTPSEPLIY